MKHNNEMIEVGDTVKILKDIFFSRRTKGNLATVLQLNDDGTLLVQDYMDYYSINMTDVSLYAKATYKERAVYRKIKSSYTTLNNDLSDYMKESKNNLNKIASAIWDLDNNIKYEHEYLTALIFLCTFNIDEINNDILKRECLTKNIEELSYNNISNLKTIDTNIATSKNPSKCLTITESDLNLCVNNITSYTIDTEISTAIEKGIKAGLGTDETEYKKVITVFDILKTPHKFDKKIVYNVYKYLLEVLDKDDELVKYEE